MIRIGLIQTCTGIDPAANAAQLAADARRLAADGAQLIFTPEMSGVLDRNSARLRQVARAEAADPTLQALAEVARDCGVTIALGSLAVRDANADHLRNRSFVIDSHGRVIGHYDKIHLFDVTLADGTRYHESATFAAGQAAHVVELAEGALPPIRLGLSICYDLRFSALYAALAEAGADLIAVPASFTVPTGTAHWHVLLRARAIETGAFVIAAAQTGRHADGRETFGHSLVVGPWGDVLLDMGTAPGAACIDIDMADVAAARARIPMLAHRRAIAGADVLRAAQKADA